MAEITINIAVRDVQNCRKHLRAIISSSHLPGIIKSIKSKSPPLAHEPHLPKTFFLNQKASGRAIPRHGLHDGGGRCTGLVALRVAPELPGCKLSAALQHLRWGHGDRIRPWSKTQVKHCPHAFVLVALPYHCLVTPPSNEGVTFHSQKATRSL